MGNLGAEKAKNQGLGWQQGCGGGGGRIGESSRGKMGGNGGKWGGNGGKGDRLHHPSFLIFPHFPPFFPISPPFFPIFPHFPPFFLAMGTLWVRLWVQYPPPEPGTSEPWNMYPSADAAVHKASVGLHSPCAPVYKAVFASLACGHRAVIVLLASVLQHMGLYTYPPCIRATTFFFAMEQSMQKARQLRNCSALASCGRSQETYIIR